MGIESVVSVNQKLQPYDFALSYKDVDFLTKSPIKFIEGNFANYMWGGYHLYAMKGMSYNKDTPVAAESWEVSGHKKYPSCILMPDGRIFTLKDLLKDRQLAESILGEAVVEHFGQNLPILVKFIDVHQHMSVHLHPSHKVAKALGEDDPGKEEIFIVIDLHEDAESVLYLGLKEKVNRRDFVAAIKREENILDLLHKIHVAPGDIFHIPSGVLHCWTGGSIAIEIAESSDLTYRMYDFLRQRQMHIEKGLASINYKCNQGGVLKKQCKGKWETKLAKGLDSIATRNALRVERIRAGLNSNPVKICNRDAFEVLMGIEGAIEIVSLKGDWLVHLHKGSSILIPAKAGDYLVRGIDQVEKNRALRISMKIPEREGK
ncbi:MAG: class I mannose-6-phosphate isomerase [Candidatus Omnitrophica bacterium]|nr:class I mannose-6-phosphate isomerase [Candidatus Omnitrophota bacterium]MBU1868880.1 class I mannose-6-phosphate isomerase [Candidatus Omnitrophota bacterium]